MKYLSTSEAAEKWNISSRRVAKLASQGRIEGVTMVGNTWLIPETAPKPEDGRTGAGNPAAVAADPYRFPDIILGVSSKEVPDLLPEEKLLYDGIRMFCKAEYTECINILKTLTQKTDLEHVKIGSYYYLQGAYVGNWQFENAAKATAFFDDSIASASSHREELYYLYLEIKSYSEGAKVFLEPFEIDYDCAYSRGFLPFIATQYAYSDVISLSTDNPKKNATYHELICMELERNGYFYSAILMHLYIAIMYSFEENENKRDMHLRKSFDLVLKHENYSVFGFYLGFYPDLELPLRKYYPKDTIDMIIEISRNRIESSIAYLGYIGGTQFFRTLTPQDYKLLSYSRTGYSINKMADLEKVSVSTIKTHLKKLYAKVNVKNKKELVDKYNELLLNMDTSSY